MQTAALGTSFRQNLTIAALGVVYGDIGTSPLYAVKQCFHDAAAITMPRVFGVLSLIVWALTIIVTIKYVIVLMRADNRGEGGIFALTILALRSFRRTKKPMDSFCRADRGLLVLWGWHTHAVDLGA
jgi:KUP system potassium uptake protein